MSETAVLGVDYEIVPYAAEHHARYVAQTFVASASDAWPWGMLPPGVMDASFQAGVHHPSSRCLVACAPGEPATIEGWIVTRPLDNEIVFGLTRYPLRRRGIGLALALAGGIDFARPVGVWFWTRACERLFREHSGYGSLYFRVCR